VARQMKDKSSALFRAVLTMTETVEGQAPKTFASQVFGPHETIGPVKAAVTRYKRNMTNWRYPPRGERADGTYGVLEIERTFEVDYQTVTIEWKSVTP
jgi:hypothetical protein